MRLAVHKYFRTKICSNKLEAITKFFDEDLGEFLSKFKSYIWREDKYFCEEVEYIIKEYSVELDALFKIYSGQYTMPSKPKFVSLEEFMDMISTSGVLSLNIANKDIGKYFNLSLQTEVDELQNEEHMQMFTLEFYEAIARIAEKVEFSQDKQVQESNTNLASYVAANSSSKKNNEMIEAKSTKSIRDNKIPEKAVFSESKSRSSSTEQGIEIEVEIPEVKEISKPRKLKNSIYIQNQAKDNESEYSLGDGDKLYLKLEKMIKKLIQNCFKNRNKRMSTKFNLQSLSKHMNATNGDGSLASAKEAINKKGTTRKYTFKRGFSKKMSRKLTPKQSDSLLSFNEQ